MNHRIFRLASSLFLALAVMIAGTTPALAAPAVPDPTFDFDGMVITTGLNVSSVYNMDIVIQPDGKIIAAGSASPVNHGDFGLVRYNSDGSLDTSFDTDGIVTTDFNNNSEVGTAVALQQDGKIVVAGFSTDSTTGVDDKFALARYNSDGSLDTAFDTDGKVITSIGGFDNAFAVALQSDGKILAAGSAPNGNNNDFALVRFNSDGSLDTAFDTDGIVKTDFGTNNGDGAGAMTLQSDGKIILAGSSFNRNTSDSDFAVARYNSNGSLDTTFDTDGKVTTDFGISDSGNGVALQSNGTIIVAGTHYDGSDNNFAMARYNSNGSLDTTFDTDGKVTWDFGGQEIGNDVAIDTNGKIVVVGHTRSDFSLSQFALARYNSNGSPDTTFDTDGMVTVQFGGDDFGQAIAIQTDGKIIVGGSTNLGFTNTVFALARFDVASSTNVTIDIKPGNKHSRIMIGSRGNASVQVAILSTQDFDANRQVDKTSLTFGATGDENSLRRRFLIGTPDCRARDVNHDRLKDLVCSFLIRQTGFRIGDTVGILKGQTVDGSFVEGRDFVQITAPSYPSYPSYP